MKNPKPSVSVISWKCQGETRIWRVRITGLELASGEKRARYFLSAVPSYTSTLVIGMNVMIQQRDGRLPWCFLWEGSVDERLCQFFYYYFSFIYGAESRLNFSVGGGHLKQLQTTLEEHIDSRPFLCFQALNAWFNLASNSLYFHRRCVCGGRPLRARGKEKMSFSCSSFRPPSKSPWVFSFQIQRQNN